MRLIQAPLSQRLCREPRGHRSEEMKKLKPSIIYDLPLSSNPRAMNRSDGLSCGRYW